jgi:hypothetical protein
MWGLLEDIARDHLIDSVLVWVFSRKFRNFKRIAEILDIAHEDLLRREIVIDVIFGAGLADEKRISRRSWQT